MRILVVEDEASLAKQLTSSIAEAGYAVDHAADGERADYMARTEQYDAIVLDLGLPKIDGFTLLRKWRDSGLVTLLLVLTACSSRHEKAQGCRTRSSHRDRCARVARLPGTARISRHPLRLDRRAGAYAAGQRTHGRKSECSSQSGAITGHSGQFFGDYSLGAWDRLVELRLGPLQRPLSHSA